MPIDRAALNTELTTDPESLGYAQWIPVASPGANANIAELINATTGAGASTLSNDPVTGSTFLAALDPVELSSLTSQQMAVVQLYTTADTVAIGEPNVQSWIMSTWPAETSPRTNAALMALFNRPCSRAEVLFGRGAQVGTSDIYTALNQLS